VCRSRRESSAVVHTRCPWLCVLEHWTKATHSSLTLSRGCGKHMQRIAPSLSTFFSCCSLLTQGRAKVCLLSLDRSMDGHNNSKIHYFCTVLNRSPHSHVDYCLLFRLSTSIALLYAPLPHCVALHSSNYSLFIIIHRKCIDFRTLTTTYHDDSSPTNHPALSALCISPSIRPKQAI
jgi:hypothetical protein